MNINDLRRFQPLLSPGLVSASEQVVIRSFPVSSLFKDKPFKVADFPHISSMEKSLQVGHFYSWLGVIRFMTNNKLM